ncbi:MAG: hypothetical protein KDA24_05630 [Deltaproteobacteria bacterium]|nr:hypothetical protein [Deltaproteobacteria bacterium]
MSDLPQWLRPAADVLKHAVSRGVLLVSDGGVAEDDARTLASSANLELVVVDARIYGLLPDGVVRGALRDELGGATGSPDEGFCVDALGDGDAALATWEMIQSGWAPAIPAVDEFVELDDSIDDEDDVHAPPPAVPTDDAGRRVEALARILAAAGDLSPRLVLVRSADHADATSLAAVRSVLASGRGAGTAWLLEGPIEESSALGRLLAPVLRAASDDRFDGPRHASITGGSTEDESPRPPGRGTAAELLAMLQAGGVPIPEALLGGQALATYRGQSPRATFQDLEGLLHTERGSVTDGWVVTDSHGAPGSGPLMRADARALHACLDAEEFAAHPAAPILRAGLALAADSPSAADDAVAAGRLLLGRGDALGAQRWLDRAASWLGGSTTPELSLLRARASREVGDARTATRIAREAILSGSGDDAVVAELHLEAGRVAVSEGDDKTASRHLQAAASLGAAEGNLSLAGEAHLALAGLLESHGQYREGAAAAAEAAKAFEHARDTISAARAFAARAVCIAGAGKAPRALQELKHAMKRTPDADDPRPGALDVRIALGLIFREAGDREKARQALALAAKRAHTHALADREAVARLNLARFYLEALPVRGAERGEALSAGREAAEESIQLARGVGRPDLEAESEALLGELAWRSEAWARAAEALSREQELWTQAGNAVRVIDVALRRGQLASRQEDWQGAFEAANAALNQAQRKRLNLKLAQAYMLRGDALHRLERKDEALQSLQEAQRIFGSLGEEYAAQAGAAERRAQQLVAGP